MFKIDGYASSRSTDAASLLEAFIDDNKYQLSINMLSALDDLAGEIDEQVQNMVEEFEAVIESKDSEIEQLEADLNDK